MKKREKLTVEQELAANPRHNVWVQANAGTGKTKVLVQRLLRILFRDNHLGQNGILCLTYTNAGAGEMRNRITRALRDWAMATDEELRELLIGVSENDQPTNTDIVHARNVFFTYIDNPDILKIKTIHGFCQEVLHRFPTEAGISPAWALVSDASQKILLNEAFDRLFKSRGLSTQTKDAFDYIVKNISEYKLDDLLGYISNLYKGFLNIDNVNNYRDYFIDTIKKNLKYKPVNSDVFPEQHLRNILKIAKSQQKQTKTLENIIKTTEQYIDKTIDFQEYKKAYLTDLGEPRKAVLGLDFLNEETERILDIVSNQTKEQILLNTVSLFDLTAAFAEIYQEIKHNHNVLDFDDLIWYTYKLFSNPETMGWVLSQMDLTLSHILVDEAQDTGSMQWQILQMLAGDFFTDGDKNELPRSLFVVGDTKQSIYGFQGADPDAFATSRDEISKQIKNNARDFAETPLTQSFRSVQPILDVVDMFFDNPTVVSSTGFINNKHKCFRQNATGCVEIHKLVEKSNQITLKHYIKIIVDKIQSLLESGKFSPQDIMILLRKRAPMATPLINELKQRGIDVAGSDRIVLPQFPVIRDLMNLVRFCINTNDDYSLGCILKSPMFRLSDTDIFNICTKKDKTTPLFDVLQNTHPEIHDILTDFLKMATHAAPYEFFTHVLNNYNIREQMVAALGNQIIDPLEEFLTSCLVYERTQPGTLKHFLKWFITGASEIKRDMEAGSGVRVVTVHGSKGLQSPVVFLIDTVSTPKTEKVIYINTKKPDNRPIWIWTPTSVKTHCPEYQKLFDSQTMQSTKEDYRLLYVAMTRAQDELYIYGFANNGTPNELAWHTMLWNIVSEHTNTQPTDDVIRITNEKQS